MTLTNQEMQTVQLANQNSKQAYVTGAKYGATIAIKA